MLPGTTPALMGGALPTNDAYVVLLLHFDGANNSTVMPDASFKRHGNANVQGTAKLQSGTGLLGSPSSCNYGTGGRVEFPNSSDWEFGSGDFTIDWWEYRIDTTARPSFVRDSLATTYQAFLIGWDIGGSMGVYASGDGATWNVINQLPLGPYNINTWTHRAVCRKGNTFYGFCNGVLQGTQTSSLALAPSSGPLSLGYWNAAPSNLFNGYQEEVRISKGIARWTANFTPPTKPYGPDAPVLAATHYAVSAPATASKGAAFNVTVTAQDVNNGTVAGYTGTVQITSTDGAATLPANATLTNGVGTFSVKLNTVGTFTVTATDTVTGSINGVSGNIVANIPAQSVALTASGNWTVPADWTSGKNSVEVIGGGGGGSGNTGGSNTGGGGGGGYAKKSNIALTPGATVGVTIGAGGAAGGEPGGTGGTTTFGSYCSATGGTGGSNSSFGNGGAGTVGDTGYSGGAGGDSGGNGDSGSGGGGAAGPSGAGARGGGSANNHTGGGGGAGGGTPGINGTGTPPNGGNSVYAAGGAGGQFGAAGAAGSNGSGGGGGDYNANGGVGGNGPDYSGGGGGGGGNVAGARGGAYGGGGGGGNGAGGAGYQGVIVIRWGG